jgi:hypothetical protein
VDGASHHRADTCPTVFGEFLIFYFFTQMKDALHCKRRKHS